MIDIDKLITLLSLRWAKKGERKIYVEEKPKYGLPSSTVATVYPKEQIERVIVRPNSIKSEMKQILVDNDYKRYFFVQRIPDEVDPTTFAEILSLDDVDLEIAYKLYPKTSFEKANEIRTSMKVLGGQIIDAKSENYDTDVLHEIISKQKEALHLLDAGVENPFRETIILIVKATNLKDLNYSSKLLDKELKRRNILIKPLDGLHLDAFTETQPLGTMAKVIPGREILSRTIERRYMLVKPQVQINLNSMIWGYDSTGLPLFFSQWEECNAYNILTTGSTGGGKSVLAKYILSGQLMMMVDDSGDFNGGFIIADPNNEYRDVVTKIANGTYIEFSPYSNIRLNILDCLNLSRGEKLSQLEYVFPLLFGENNALSENMWTVLRKALVKCYESKGIQHDYHVSKGYKEQPTTNDLYIQIVQDQKEAGTGSNLRQAFEAVLNKLSKFVDIDQNGIKEYGQFAFMAEPTKGIDVDKLERLGFSIQGVERSIKSAFVYIFIDMTWRLIEKNRKKATDDAASRFLFFMDEVHMLFGNQFVRENINQMAAIARKYYVSMYFITQRLSTYKDGDGEGSSILANTHVKIFLQQDDIEASQIGKIYHMDQGTVDRLQTLGMGQYYLMVKAKKYKFGRFLYNRVFQKGLQLFETNPQKIIENRKKWDKEKQALYRKFDLIAEKKMQDYFRDKDALKKYKKLAKDRDKLSEKELKQLKEYEENYLNFGINGLSESELTTYEFMKFEEQLDNPLDESKLVDKQEVAKDDVIQAPKFYYFVDQLDSDVLDELQKSGYITINYKTSRDSSLTYVTKIQTHVKHRAITQHDANMYGSAKNMARLDPEVKHAIDHHMMIVHSHSILRKFGVEEEKIKLWETSDVDVEFPGPDGNKFAIEAESGSAKLEHEHLKTKINRNNEKYGKNWIFYVPSQDTVKYYIEAFTKYSDTPITLDEAKERVLTRTQVYNYVSSIFMEVGKDGEE